ncbi:hypothetical protein L0668_18565 [Paraglaciecola aquimarina]|uniref:Uncharacterized protein n=1 Tax=Paraglaciecola algarum TaxID=3050085 RepID=A0ABS9DBC1_9ALTE|nr:hypothetical protein [Paraglaciecola sp. G1-23]MCF2950125.1 hypothetical protein [Paraglaciecola sp. G1-23]
MTLGIGFTFPVMAENLILSQQSQCIMNAVNALCEARAFDLPVAQV